MADNLRQFISTLQPDAGGADAAAGAGRKPSIRVSAKDTGNGGEFTVTGSGFTPSANVRIRIVDDALTEIDFPQSADASGGLKAVLDFPCIGGLALHFSATSGVPDPSDLTGVQWSNTFTIPCPCAPPKPGNGDDGNGGGSGSGDGNSGNGDTSGAGGNSSSSSDSSGDDNSDSGG